MIKFGVWFLGNSEEAEGICYYGKEVFLADKCSDAIDYMQVLQDNQFEEKASNLFKLIKLEIL